VSSRNLEEFFLNEGVKGFTNSKHYWRWVNSKVGPKKARKFAQMMSQRATTLPEGSGIFYDFLAEPGLAAVAAGFEYNLLIAILRWVEQRLPERGLIVELGCHTGLLSRYYALARPEAAIIGIDLSQTAIETAQRRSEAQRLENIHFYAGDLRDAATLPRLEADCIISGRVFSELMTPIRRHRESWEDFRYPNASDTLDESAHLALQACSSRLKPRGRLLLTERISDFDRLNRLWKLLFQAGYSPKVSSVTPIAWKDIAGNHQTWFFQAERAPRSESLENRSLLIPPNVPVPLKELEATGNPSRVTLDGILAWATWRGLAIQQRSEEGLLRWAGGEEIHYEIGTVRGGMGYAYVASNTDIHTLSLCLPQELETARRDLQEYVLDLRQSGGKPVSGWFTEGG
jgi:SAM-dependent methyltransferase